MIIDYLQAHVKKGFVRKIFAGTWIGTHELLSRIFLLALPFLKGFAPLESITLKQINTLSASKFS